MLNHDAKDSHVKMLIEESPTKQSKSHADFKKLYRNRNRNPNEPASYPIDPNHTHFILLDDDCGSDDENWKKYGYKIRADLTLDLRAEIEKEARKYEHHGQSKAYCLLWQIITFVFQCSSHNSNHSNSH